LNILRKLKEIKIEELRGAVLFIFENVNKPSNTVSVCVVREFGCNSEIGGSEFLGEKGGGTNTVHDVILNSCQTQT
jgi:hypothetical protein